MKTILAIALSITQVPYAPLSAQTADVQTLSGRCTYPSAMGPASAGEHRSPCDTVIVSSGRSGGVLIQFAVKHGKSLVGFAGPVSGDLLTVERIYLRPGIETVATGGHCKIFYHGGDTPSGLSCVGKVGSRAEVANFETVTN